MSKLRKSILIIGILIIVIAASLATALALLATGTIKTDPIELIYSVKDAEKIYDGSPLKATEYRLTSGVLGEGHTAQVEILGEQTAVGTSKSDLSVKIYDKDGYNVSNNYSIKVNSGDLTVTKKSIKIDLPSQKAIYNGSTVALTNYRVTEDSKGDLVAGHKIYGSTDAGLLNVGDTVPEGLTPLVFDVAGNNVTENYEIEFTVGEIEVVPRYISLRPVSVSKVYDGEKLVADGIEFVEGSVVEGQRIEYKINENLSNEMLDAGFEETRVTSVSIFATVDGKEVDVTDNYEIDTFETGTLEITPRPLTVTALSGSWIYDGNAHTLKEETQPYSVEGLAPCDKLIDVQYSGTITDVGEAVNLISNVSLSCYSENYDIKTVNGTLTVTPFELTVKTASAEKYYDGEPLKAENIEAEPAKGQTVTPAENESFPEITDAGSIVNEFECRVFFNGENVTKNYIITYDYGTLTVNKLPVTVELGSEESVIYNGTSQTPDLSNADYFRLKSVDEENTQSLNNLLSGKDNFEVVSYSKSMINVGVYTYTVRFNNKKHYANYALEVPDNGYFTINPKPLTITTGSSKQVYSGSPLTNGVFDVAETTETRETTDTTVKIDNHVVAAPAELPSITDVGEIKNDFAVTIVDENGEDVIGNYKITYNYGTLTVTQLKITVTLKSEIEHTYNGKAAIVTPEEAIIDIESEGNEIDGDIIKKSDFTVKLEEEAVNVKVDDNGKGIAYNYTVEITDAKFGKNFNLEIVGDAAGDKEQHGVMVVPADISVKIKDIKQTYDGEEHLLDAYTAIYSVEDNVTGLTRDDFSISFIDSAKKLIDAGDYAYTVKLSQEKAVNYSVNVTNAEGRTAVNNNYPANYTINQFVVDVTTASKIFVYDGEAHSCGEFTHTPLANRAHTIVHQLTEDRLTAVTEVKDGNKPNKIDVYDVFAGNDSVTKNYDIVVHYGTLSVTPLEVKVTLKNLPDSDELADKLIYDGEAKTINTDEAVASISYGNGNGAELITNGELQLVYGSIVDAGEYTYTAKFAEGVEVGNYELEVTDGTIKVEKLSVIVTLKDYIGGDALIYDGEKKTLVMNDDICSISYGNGNGAELITNADLQLVYGSIVDAGEYTYSAKFAEGVKVGNYDLEVTDGTIKVEKLSVIVTLKDYIGDGDALVYDGKEKTIDKSYVDDITDDKYFTVPETLLPKSALVFAVTDGKVIRNADTYSYSAYLTDERYTKNIDIQCEAKTIVVAPLEVNLTLKNYTEAEGSAFTFDNTEKTIDLKEALTVDTGLLTYADFEVVAGAIKNADSYEYRVKFVDEEYAKNFSIDLDNVIGEVQVSKLTVYVTADDYVLTYNGEAQSLKVREALIFSSDLVNSANFELEYTFVENDGSSNEVDEVKKAGNYLYKANIEENLSDEDRQYLNNFDLQFVKGKITVKKLGVILTLENFTHVYDGSEYRVDPNSAVVADTYLLSGDDLVIKYESKNATTDRYEEVAAVRNAGEYVYKVSLSTDASRENAKNFEIMATRGGKITVEKLEVNVKLGSVSAVYSGLAYNLEQAKTEIISGCVVDTNLLKADNFNFAYVQSDNVAVGSHAYTATLPATGDNSNFKLNVSYGNVVVTPRPVTITVEGARKVYDGNELKKSDLTAITLANAVANHTANVTNSVSITDVGSVPNALICTIYDERNVDVTANYEIEYVYGNLEITPLEVTVELADFTGTESLEYTGEKQSLQLDKAITLTTTAPDNLISAADFEIVCDKELVNAGTYTYTVRYKGKAANFDFGNDEAQGHIRINKKELLVNVASFVNVAGAAEDGFILYNALTYTGYDYANLYLNNGVWKRDNISVVTANYHNFTGDDFRFVYSGEMKNVGTYNFGVEFANSAYNDNYTVTMQVGGGIMQIVPLDLTVTLKDFTGGDAFIYNGKKADIDVNSAIEKIELANTVGESVAEIITELGGVEALIGKNEFSVYTPTDIIMVKGNEDAYGNFTYDKYDYSVEIAAKLTSRNFNVNCVNADGEEGGKVEVHKRKIAITLGDLVVSSLVADSYNSRFLVTNLVSVSGATPLAEGDYIVITEAYADGSDVDYTMALDPGSFTYTISNEICYEFDFTNTTAHVTILSPAE